MTRDRFGKTTERNDYLRTLPDYWQLERDTRRGGWLIRVAIVAAVLALWVVMR
jgi:predicted lipid-binding transport protein (Tim44 family)